MSKCPIGFGCSKYYLFVFGTTIIKILKLLIFSISPNKKGGLFGFTPTLDNHNFIQSIYKYISFIFGGLIFTYLIKIKTKKENPININQNLKIKGLIHNKKGDELEKKTIYQILLVCFIFFFHQESTAIFYMFNLYYLDFWVFDFIFIFLFMNIFFIMNIYKHQKCSMIFIIITNFILLLISSFLPMIDDKDSDFYGKNSYQIIEKVTDNSISFVGILFAFIFISFILSYARVKTKVLIDFFFILPYKLIFYIGLIGFFFTTVALIISTFTKCQGREFIVENVCMKEKNTTDFYFDSISIYFNNLRDNPNFYLEIFVVTPCYIIICFLEFTFEIMIINYLNPIFVLIKDNLYYFIVRIFNFALLHPITLAQFIILELAEALAILAYSVFLEVIEFRFLGLDKDIKRNISERGSRETISIEETKDLDESFEDENHNNNNNENLELKND